MSTLTKWLADEVGFRHSLPQAPTARDVWQLTRGPVVWTAPNGMSCVTNVFSSRRRCASMIGAYWKGYGAVLHGRLSPSDGTIWNHEFVPQKNAGMKLSDLPAHKHYDADSQPSITGGVLGVDSTWQLRRAVVLDDERLAVWVHPTARAYERVHDGSKASFIIGGSPANYLGIRSTGTWLGASLYQPVLEADIIVAGEFRNQEVVSLGPFVEWRRLLGKPRDFHIMHVNQVLVTSDPTYLDIWSGGPDEAYGLGQHDKEAVVTSFRDDLIAYQSPYHPGHVYATYDSNRPLAWHDIPRHIDMWLSTVGCHYVPPLTAVSLFPADLVDIYSAESVLWAISHLTHKDDWIWRTLPEPDLCVEYYSA